MVHMPGEERSRASRPLDEEDVKLNQLEVILRLLRDIKAMVEGRYPEMQEAGRREAEKLWENFWKVGDSLDPNGQHTPLPPADQPLPPKKEDPQS